ncbi:RluA family pseudouridine synthase [Facklamia miroungae]|uniref:Pseudouridine synthase n=1 Tax=Facklamia miroungae TaxID=120956 RepID=A0A1G7P9S4_9LACT|nr:RluA family pseudouridine synthase [Facklamia miroungae]NKZ28634.1 RluA family pseudouridine synthase [Facklamia miroungae]SDF83056.1 23S rRNA pseudouridine1911/1915/1917 synthase [Facklamia miroungae]
MIEKIRLTQKSSDNDRLDKVLTTYFPSFSRSQLQKLIKDKKIKVNGQHVKANSLLQGDERIEIDLSEAEKEDETFEVVAEAMDLDIIHEDTSILVVNKPAGMVVHPSKGHINGTLVNGLYHYLGNSLSSGSQSYRPGIVHRIDKDTSGLLVVAKTDQAHRHLSRQLIDHTMGRTYQALVNGQVETDSGHIEMPVKRDPSNRLRWHVDESGKEAITNFQVIKRYQYATLLELKLQTGRTHQIRIHMEAIGHPIIGDPLYRRNLQNLPGQLANLKDGQLLHAKAIDLIHPVSNEKLHFECPLPFEMQNIINSLQ